MTPRSKPERLEVKRFSFRHRYYIGFFEGSKRLKDYKQPWSSSKKDQYDSFMLALRREGIIGGKPAEGGRPSPPSVTVDRTGGVETKGLESSRRHKFRAVPKQYHEEKIRNVHTGKEYFLRYRNGAKRTKTLRKMLNTMDSSRAEEGSKGDWSMDDFETVSIGLKNYREERDIAPEYRPPGDPYWDL